jgi:hypothetical protein
VTFGIGRTRAGEGSRVRDLYRDIQTSTEVFGLTCTIVYK